MEKKQKVECNKSSIIVTDDRTIIKKKSIVIGERVIRKPTYEVRLKKTTAEWTLSGQSFDSCEVILSSRLASYIKNGDVITWWDEPADELGAIFIPCKGKLIFPYSKLRIYLKGYKEGGKDCVVGRTHLDLDMIKSLDEVWKYGNLLDPVMEVVQNRITGKIYVCPEKYEPGPFNTSCLIQSGGYPYCPEVHNPPIANNECIVCEWDSWFMSGWKKGYLYILRKDIQEVEANIPKMSI